MQTQTRTDHSFRAIHAILRVLGCPLDQGSWHVHSLAVSPSCFPRALVAAGALKDVQEMKESLQQVGTSAHSAESL